MTAMQTRVEIFRNLSVLADDDEYMKRASVLLGELVAQKGKEEAKDVRRFRVDMERPLSTDKYVGMITASMDEDEEAKREYLLSKYGGLR